MLTLCGLVLRGAALAPLGDTRAHRAGYENLRRFGSAPANWCAVTSIYRRPNRDPIALFPPENPSTSKLTNWSPIQRWGSTEPRRRTMLFCGHMTSRSRFCGRAGRDFYARVVLRMVSYPTHRILIERAWAAWQSRLYSSMTGRILSSLIRSTRWRRR